MSKDWTRIVVTKWRDLEVSVTTWSDEEWKSILKPIRDRNVQSGVVEWYRVYETNDWFNDLKELKEKYGGK